MKRKIFGAILLVALAIAAGWNFNQSRNKATLSELGLANVEALAANEGGPICRTNSSYTSICNVYDSGAVCPCGF